MTGQCKPLAGLVHPVSAPGAVENGAEARLDPNGSFASSMIDYALSRLENTKAMLHILGMNEQYESHRLCGADRAMSHGNEMGTPRFSIGFAPA